MGLLYVAMLGAHKKLWGVLWAKSSATMTVEYSCNDSNGIFKELNQSGKLGNDAPKLMVD